MRRSASRLVLAVVYDLGLDCFMVVQSRTPNNTIHSFTAVPHPLCSAQSAQLLTANGF